MFCANSSVVLVKIVLNKTIAKDESCVSSAIWLIIYANLFSSGISVNES